MKKMMKITLLILLVFIVFIALLYVLIGDSQMQWYQKIRPIEHTQVASFDAPLLFEDTIPVVPWFSQRSQSFRPLSAFSTKIVRPYGVDLSDFEFDFDQHTYIITIGRQLYSIEYSYSRMNTKFGLPREFIGIVTLYDIRESKVFIYAIPRMNIDNGKGNGKVTLIDRP